MRMRRKKWALKELNECNYYIKNPKEYKGIWHNAFKRKQDLHLELGCGKGVFTSVIAANNPNINYIALDISTDVLGSARRNIENKYKELNAEIDNILILAYNAQYIFDIFSENDIVNRLYINFCNPWPKPKHKKRRLTFTNQLNKYKTFLNKNSSIYFKTDDLNLFEESIGYFNDSGFKIERITYNLYKENYDDESFIKTEHEIMFLQKDIKIKFAEFKLKEL